MKKKRKSNKFKFLKNFNINLQYLLAHFTNLDLILTIIKMLEQDIIGYKKGQPVENIAKSKEQLKTDTILQCFKAHNASNKTVLLKI